MNDGVVPPVDVDGALAIARDVLGDDDETAVRVHHSGQMICVYLPEAGLALKT